MTEDQDAYRLQIPYYLEIDKTNSIPPPPPIPKNYHP